VGAVLLTKLRGPEPRGDLVPRPVLHEQLSTLHGYKLTLVAAPAGSGKTTLVATWQRLTRPRVAAAWLSIDQWDNDPVRFWTYVIEAVRTVRPHAGAEALALLRAPGTRLLETVVPALINELDASREQVVLVLDDYHLITNTAIHESVELLLERLPPAFRLLIASRSDPPLPLARMRARGELLEIRAKELRFTSEESDALLNGLLGLRLEREDVDRLHDRTEGWAAGLYLAALSLRGHADPHQFIAAFAGDDRQIVDYLAVEVLQAQTEAVRTFMLRTSILERLSGPLCDAVIGTTGSAELLAELERANLFVVPLDNRRHWFRYHHLFGRLLLHELEQTEPQLVALLHRRACAWYRAEDSIPEAIHHALGAGDADLAAELVAEHWNAFFNHGRLATVTGWLDSLPRSIVESDRRLCIARGWLALDLGHVDEVERWIDMAEYAQPAETPAGAGSLDPDTAVLRMVYRFKTGDVGLALQEAEETLDLAPAEAVFPRTVARCIHGIGLYWSGEVDRAVEALEEAARHARSARNDLAAAYALGYLSVLHAEGNRPAAADQLVSEARELSDEPGFSEHFVSMMVHLGEAKARAKEGRLEEAESAAGRAHELALRGAGRIELASALQTLAEVLHARGDRTEARRRLVEARAILESCPDPRRAGDQLTRAERRLRVPTRRAADGEATTDGLTERELAVLRLLETDLSQREIGATLYVSVNTVKTHMRGIFRKLGASSRGEAVEQARALRLL
jgi:LuxR family maltose regulon positive regulatory protein